MPRIYLKKIKKIAEMREREADGERWREKCENPNRWAVSCWTSLHLPHLFTPVLIKSTEMRFSPSHATYRRLFPSIFRSSRLAPMLYLSEGGLMPASTHLPTLLPAANENEPGWREEVASHYELLMRSIRERPWPRPPAMSDCCLYLLHAEMPTVPVQTCAHILLDIHTY